MQRMTDEKMLTQRTSRSPRCSHASPKMRLLHGTELNIDPEGDVDWDDGFLAGFDLTVASVHSHFTLPAAEQTARVIRAIEHPYVNIIGHLTGTEDRRDGRRSIWILTPSSRPLREREPRSRSTAHSARLDLKDEHILWARRHGVRFAIDTDAHSPAHLDLMRFGVGTAQRGWLTKDDVINAWPLGKLERFLRKGRAD